MQTWWDYRHLLNILFVHFNDLLEDLNSEILRVAHFLDIEVSKTTLESTENAASFPTMKANADQIFPNAARTWVGGAQTFFHSGTSGRWREALTVADLQLYKDAVNRVLSLDCASWLERGRLSRASHLES
jgi:aryl sulfotransferase